MAGTDNRPSRDEDVKRRIVWPQALGHRTVLMDEQCHVGLPDLSSC